MSPFRKTILLVAALVAIILALAASQSFHSGVADNDSVGEADAWPGKRELYRKLWRERKMLFVYATGNRGAAPFYSQFAQEFAKQNDWLKIEVKADTMASAEELTQNALYLVGSRFKSKQARELISALPFGASEAGFSIGDLFSSEPSDVLFLSRYPNPLNREFPIFCISADADEPVIDLLPHLGNSFRQPGDFLVYRGEERVVLGFFRQEGSGPWQVDSEHSRNYLTWSGSSLDSEHFRFESHGDKTPDLRALSQRYEQYLQRLVSTLEISSEATMPSVTIHLYESAEDKALKTGNADLSHRDESRNEVHAIHNGMLRGSDFFSTAKLLIQTAVGETNSPALSDGLAMAFSEDWGKLGYQAWARRIYDASEVDSLRSLLDADIYNKESYLFMRPLAGAFAAFLLDRFGPQRTIELYRTWPRKGLPTAGLNGVTVAELENGWRAYLASLPDAGAPRNNVAQPHQPGFQKGFCYAHEGYQIYNGYLSRKSAAALARLSDLGTNWISITPFGYLDDRNQPGYLHYSFRPGSENDESVITAFSAARQNGMRAMLKPHVLMNSMNFGWPGEVKMTNETDWQKFFAYYKSWLRHYALLAEMYGIDMLCIGTELVNTTRNHQDEWRKLISGVRKIYHGPLVYAANWGEEFEQIEFWDELDYIGLNCYYPLSSNNETTLDDLKRGAEKIAAQVGAQAAKFQKPVIFTEIGFTSTAGNWQQPHERRRGSPVNLRDQAMCYRAVFETFWSKPWFHGFYWWKWPTYMEYGGPHHNGFTPNRKPAEDVVREWYTKKRS